jgi:Undecaprenyl-phosphate glucose phosphotransferase
MLKRHSEFFLILFLISDLILISASWVVAYSVRVSGILIPVTPNVPPLTLYLWLLLPILVFWGMCFHVFDLYRPRRMSSHVSEFLDIAKANTISVLVLVSITLIPSWYEYSRLVFLYFWLINLVVLGFSRRIFREALRLSRRLGYNKRYVLVVGAGKLGEQIVRNLRHHPEFGMSVRGYLTRRPDKVGKILQNVPVVGTYSQIKEFVASGVDIVFICLPAEEAIECEKILEFLSTTMVEIKIVPSIYEFMTIHTSAEMFEGLPLITLQGTPLHGLNILIKRSTDIVGAMVALVISSPLLAIIAMCVKLQSAGPVFYRQVRTGLDGREFYMLKFRTMRSNAEEKSGPVWTQKEDARRTAVGTFLRRTSLDELPQFWNVLKGEMSIVGPRPERPELIALFRDQYPQYMLRHKMKAGMTGWAQINGWRGNTDLKKRLDYDMYYIEHWSIWFDVKIMALTLWKGLVHQNAY